MQRTANLYKTGCFTYLQRCADCLQHPCRFVNLSRDFMGYAFLCRGLHTCIVGCLRPLKILYILCRDLQTFGDVVGYAHLCRSLHTSADFVELMHTSVEVEKLLQTLHEVSTHVQRSVHTNRGCKRYPQKYIFLILFVI